MKKKDRFLSIFQKLVYALLAVYLASSIQRALLNPSGAHGLRQIDTAGVTVSIVDNFKTMGWKGIWDGLLYPRLLQRGLTSGINVTEFPLLNALTVPLFFWSPHAGVIFGSLLISALAFFAAFWSLPKLWKAWGVNLPRWFGPLVYFSLASIGFHSAIYMPEGIAFPLLITGAALLCSQTEKSKWNSWLPAYLCLTLALSVKPLAVVGLLPLALWPILKKPFPSQRFWAFYIGTLALSFLLPLWWFKIHAKDIIWIADHVTDPSQGGLSPYSKTIMSLSTLSPFARLAEPGLMGIWGLLIRQLNTDQFPFYCGLLWTGLALYLEPLLLGGLILMLLGAISLLGAAIWVHGYYFFATSLMSLILIGKILTRVPSRALHILCCITLVWGVLYTIRGNVWVSYRTIDLWKLSAPLVSVIPQDAHIVTDDLDSCPTKLINTGRPGTLAPFQIGSICRDPGYKTMRLAFMIDESRYLREKENPESCISQAKFLASATGQIESRSENWVVLVREPNP